MDIYTDLHCHILPEIDDGAKNIAEARELLEMSLQQGIKHIVFTPHFYPERMTIEEFLENRCEAEKSISGICNELGICFRVGAEVQISALIDTFPLDQLCFSGTSYLLLELFTAYEPYDTEGIIRRICKKGYVPILAHIERYPYLIQNPPLLYRWIRAGALAQVNAGWILKDQHALKWVKQLHRWNCLHIVSSDAHSVDMRPQNLRVVYDLLPREIANDLRNNANIIFAGDEITKRDPVNPVKRFGIWK